jgi:hypothetical protein
VSRICCPLVSYSHFIHSFTCLLVPILPYFHSPCIFPIRPSHSILLSFAYLGAYCLQIACIIRLGDSERHATPRPRFAALRHPIFLVSTLPTTWPSIAPGRPLTGTHTHTPTAYTHSLIHSFTYYSYDHHHSCGEEHRQTGIPRLSAFAFERNIRQVPRNRITKNKETDCQQHSTS